MAFPEENEWPDQCSELNRRDKQVIFSNVTELYKKYAALKLNKVPKYFTWLTFFHIIKTSIVKGKYRLVRHMYECTFLCMWCQ